jgi:glycosyltransferase involved in cell wall biosynthesis
MTTPLVSIVIPAYKAGRYITTTLASVRAQTHTRWELLICEDGIFDDTAEQVKTFAANTTNPVRFFQNPKNLGVSQTRNRLLDASQGDFIAFLDADDLWTPDHLAHSLATMEAEHTDWIIGGLNRIDSLGHFTEQGILPPVISPQEMPTQLLSYNFILPSGMVTRAKVFGQGLRFDTHLSVGEDLDLCIQIVETGHKASFSRKATLNYRKHPASATGEPARFSEGMAQLYAKHLRDPAVDQAFCLHCLIDSLTNTARLTRKTQAARCRKAARQLIGLRPWHPIGWFYYLASFASPTTLNESQKKRLNLG